MSTHNVLSRRGRRIFWAVPSILGGLLLVFQLLVLSASQAHAASGPSTDLAPQPLMRAGVSLVRLQVDIANSPSAGSPAHSIQCLGVGSIVRSWSSTDPNERNVWVLTSGNFVDSKSQQPCNIANPISGGKLFQVAINYSSTYNSSTPFTRTLNAAEIKDLDTPDSDIRCNRAPDGKSCLPDSPTLFAYHEASHQIPYLDLTSEVGDNGAPITLGSSSTATSLPIIPTPVSDNVSPGVEDLKNAAALLRTPALSQEQPDLESGTPYVDSRGHLVKVKLADGKFALAKTISELLTQQAELKTVHPNLVKENWDNGLTALYTNDKASQASAVVAFNTIKTLDKDFTGVDPLIQNVSATPVATVSSINGATGENTPQDAGGWDLFGQHFSYWFVVITLCILGLVLLIGILLVVTVLFGRRRSLGNKEWAEVERTADADADRIRKQEASQYRAQNVPQAAGSVQGPPGSGPFASNSGPLEDQPTFPLAPSPLPVAEPPTVPIAKTTQPMAPPPPSSPPQVVAPVNSLADVPTMRIIPHEDDTEKTVVPVKKPAIHEGKKFLVTSAALSNPGIKRKHKPNEDSMFSVKGVRPYGDTFVPFALLVIADGMGGHANGQNASRLAIQTVINFILPRLIKEAEFNSEGLIALLTDGVQSANQAVHGQNVQENGDMGTTMTAALILGPVAYVANVGDSRTYLYRQGQGLSKVTNDHSVVASLVDAGIIKPDDIYTHPKRNQIYRSLGEKQTIEVDHFEVQLQVGDRLLLCSDGLWDMVRDPEIARVMEKSSVNLSETAEGLIQAALNGGGEDNVSVVLGEVAERKVVARKPDMHVLAQPETVVLPTM